MKEIEEGMTAEREGRILEDAIAKFGKEVQINIMIEEMAELTKALLKYRRWHEGTGAKSDERLSDILEEMADVQIMLNQMVLIFGDSTEYEIAKLERLEKRLSEYAGVDD